MFKINLFTFTYKDNDVLTFYTAKEAILFFNHKGYGMENWKIKVDYSDSGNSDITLATFNYITDVQEYIDNLKNL